MNLSIKQINTIAHHASRDPKIASVTLWDATKPKFCVFTRFEDSSGKPIYTGKVEVNGTNSIHKIGDKP